MKSFKIFTAALICILVTLLCACGQSNINPGGTAGTDGSSSTPAATFIGFDDSDYNTSYTSQAAEIVFSQSGVSAEGSSVSVEGNTAVITNDGEYIVSGQSQDGRLIVDAEDCSVHIIFNGLTLECATSAPVYIKQADKTIITLNEGTKNYITDCESCIYDDAQEEEPNAAVFSKDDLTINGLGYLEVTARFNNGIGSKDVLKITGGVIKVEAADDGIVGRDCLAIDGGEIEVAASGDGLKSTNDEDSEKGNIIITSGSITINAEKDGVQAVNSLLVSGGKHTVTSGGGSESSSNYSSSWDSQDSQKGLKAQNDLSISGGIFNIDSADDALHSNGTLTVSGGDITVSTGDDGVHADDALTISNGNINVLASYEGLEGLNVFINGGHIIVHAEDDGINSAGGSDSGGMRPGDGFSFRDDSTASDISIINGYIYVEASGDGLDSNGSIYMSGGTLLVSGPTDGGNGAIDYEGAFELSGGILAAAGSSAMAMNVSQAAGQGAVMVTFDQTYSAGETIALTDRDGNPIVVFKPEKSFNSIVVSSPQMQEGETCLVYAGGQADTDSCGFASDNYTPGELLYEITLSQLVMNAGSVSSGMQPGGGMPSGGGMRPGGMGR